MLAESNGRCRLETGCALDNDAHHICQSDASRIGDMRTARGEQKMRKAQERAGSWTSLQIGTSIRPFTNRTRSLMLMIPRPSDPRA